MSDYSKLEAEFEHKVSELQKNCSHDHVSAWRKEYWTYGHSTGYAVKSCLVCNKVLKKQLDYI